jgi:hypothetical protein
MKTDPKDIENLLKYGGYAFLEESSGDNLNNTHIDDVIAKISKDFRQYKITKGFTRYQTSPQSSRWNFRN